MLLLGLCIVGILVLIYWTMSTCPVELPDVYQYGSGSPNVVIVAGTHGNESAPAHFLHLLVSLLDDQKFNPNYSLTIVPYVNPAAIRAGTRSLWCQADVNRSWTDNKTVINEYLLPYIDNADIVLDMHEAWGFHTCSNGQSLGQTIYTNNSSLDSLGKSIVDSLNDSFDYPDPCALWTQRYKMDHIPGALDDYCSSIGTPYLLAEITGQNDIIDMKTRMQEAQVIVTSFLNYLNLSFL